MNSQIKLVIETAAQANFLWGTTYWEYSNIYGTKKFLDKGIQVTRLPMEEINKLEKIKKQACHEAG